jgi:hypothetical protein
VVILAADAQPIVIAFPAENVTVPIVVIRELRAATLPFPTN